MLATEVTEAREGRLSFWGRLRHRLHLALCPGCRAYLRGFDQVAVALRSRPREQPPDELREELAARLRAPHG